MSLVAVLILLAAHTAPATAQQKAQTVSGTVLDPDGNPLIGATVVVVKGTQGAVTDVNGKFTIKAKSSDSLQISYLGYKTETMNVGSRTNFTVRMEKDSSTDIDEIVVIGYGQVAKKDLTGSVATVKMNDIKDVPVLSVDNALQGRIAGADFMSTTGEPGATTTIRIRGTRSINASNEPLIVVDGVMDAIHDLNDINSDDIASISVLKDASSTAIYGSRGANGVILITTKRGLGTTGKPNITFKTDIGFSQLPRHLDIMNAAEFAQYRNDYASFGSDAIHPDIGADTPLSGSVYSDPLSLGEGTNWIKEITRTALYSNYALSLSGTNDKSSYYASFSYNDTEGIIQDSGQQRFTGRINLERQLFKWMKVGYTGSYTWRHNDQNKSSIGGTAWYSSAQYLSPLLKPNDTYNPLYYNGQKINTQRALIDLNTYYLERHSNNHAFTLKLEPVKNFTINSTFSYYLYQRHTYRYYPGTLPLKGENEGGEAYRAEWDEHSFSWETTAGYKFEKNGHAFDILGGFSAYSFASHDFNLSGKGYMDDAILWNNMNAVQDKETYSAGTSYSKKTKTSIYARLNYNWKSRYYLTVTGRYDGASNFAANKKWGFFPSAALRWNIANEKFLQKAKWIDELALRASLGRTGNDAISASRSLAAVGSSTSGYLMGGTQQLAVYPSRLASPDLTWETSDQYTLGADISLFDGRLNVTADAYLIKTRDLLLTVQVASQTGYTNYFANAGRTTNKGWELTVESRNIVRPKFQWSTTLTLSRNRQMVDDIASEDFVTAYSSPSSSGTTYMMYGYKKGYTLNALWGFRYGGVWHNQEEVERNKITKAYASASGNTFKPGYARYQDINHDGALNSDDLVYLGSADPDLYGGIQNTFNIHNFTFSFFFNYSIGGKIYNVAELWMGNGSPYTNQYKYMQNSWHPVRNPNSNLPMAGSYDALPSDRLVHDASYLRLKNISASYTFDMRKVTKNRLRDIRVSVSGENLYLWKKYNGFDPDVSTSSSNSALRRVDIGAYPKPRTIIFSLQIRY